MLIIELQFLTGKFHATPWGRNVNEGEAEWPPSPFRLARALVDVWKRKKADWPDSRMRPILRALSAPVRFLLPDALYAHTRSFLSSNERDPSGKQLVFDPFIALDQGAKVLMGFDSDLPEESKRDLAVLLSELNYLGRSESWVLAYLGTASSPSEWNCIPVDSEFSQQKWDVIRVACLLPSPDFERLPYRPSCTWVEALCLNSQDLLREGWSNPPALHWVTYSLERKVSQRPAKRDISPKHFRYAKYALSSKVLPSIQETVLFAERVRGHLMGIHKRIKNQDPSLVSRAFSGKDVSGNTLKGHRHAFFLPTDEDCDGRLDHLLVSAAEPFDESELMALDRLRSVWQSKGRPDVNFILTSLSAEIPGETAIEWVSTTPFITSRHYRKGRGHFGEWLTCEVVKECSFHGLPEPRTVTWIPHTIHTPHEIRWFDFVRSRKNTTPPHGYGCILKFDKPTRGPFAVGSGCHFGLGLFMPLKKDVSARTSSQGDLPEGLTHEQFQ
jgi:CRISPR-associated protein Csb2